MSLPPIKWAQRKDALYITIDVADIKDQVIQLDSNKLNFRCGNPTKLVAQDAAAALVSRFSPVARHAMRDFVDDSRAICC